MALFSLFGNDLPTGFDPEKYMQLNPDVRDAFNGDPNQAVQHWYNWGKAENRNYGQEGWSASNTPDFWAGSGKSAEEVAQAKALGYGRPETLRDYGEGTPFWNQLGGVTPNDPGWNDYVHRTQNWSSTGSPEAQARLNDDEGGLFGNQILNTIGQIAASYFGGPIGAGAYTAASGGDIGDILLSAGATYAGGQFSGTGSGAPGGSWYSPSGDLGSIFNGAPGAETWGAADAANTYGTFEGMGSSAMDFSNLGDLWNYGSEAGGSSLSDLSAAADQFGWSDLASPGTSIGVNADIGGSSWFNTLIEQAKADPLGTAAKAVKSVLGGSGGTGSNTSALSALAKLYSAYNSEGNLKDAIGANQGAIDRAVNWQDPNQPRGNEANRLWTENYTNPKAGYNEFMQGAGREFTDQARAAAAKSGKRGSYLNSGKMQSDLASLWMKNQFSRGDSLAKGFTNPRNYAADALRDSLGLSDLYKQKGGSIGMAVGDLLGSSQARELISNITGSYW